MSSKTSSIRAGSLALLITFFGFAAGNVWGEEDLSRLNQDLIAEFNRIGNQLRDRGGDSRIPPMIASHYQKTLPKAGIPVYPSLMSLVNGADPSDVVIQEYLRSQQDGMPWLPLSFSGGTLVHTENDWNTIRTSLNTNIFQKLGNPLTEDGLLIAFLYNGSIYHAPNGSFIETLRVRADALGVRDAVFYPIRNEIHQEPSLGTIQKVIYYRQNQAKNDRDKQAADEIESLLGVLFGNADVQSYLSNAEVLPQYREALKPYIQVMNSVAGTGDPALLIDSVIEAVGAMATAATLAANSIKAGSSGVLVHIPLDFVRQCQRAAFALGSAYFPRLQAAQSSISPNDLFWLTREFFKIDAATGLLPKRALETLDRFDAKFTTEGASIPISEVEGFLKETENELGLEAKRLRGVFGSYFARYKTFVPHVDRFVDSTLRSSAVLPLSNLLSHVQGSLAKIRGVPIQVGNASFLTTYRVLNPGISKGELVIVSEQDAARADYLWHPEKIYLLVRTPAWMQKVAGVLTCESGSMISHVQLLASNHGIPNVHVKCSIRERIQAWAGQEVMLIATPGGSVTIKLAKDATDAEKQVYDEYNQVRQRIKLTIPRPDRLDINYPLRVEQLRMGHRGSVAGGKACGQGELATVFPETVPRGFVLPFGVYYEHMKESGIYDDIQKTFNNTELRGSTPEVVQKRRSELGRIRDRIRTVPLKADLEKFLIQVLLSYPFRDEGVFVRSDTNAEDLPGFVGAGLNETIPNVKGVDNILQAIREVWSSPFTEKAFTWREDLIENPWDIFPSVIIQLAINSDKAGVMIVGDHFEDDRENTVILAGNEGLGITTVNGEFVPEELKFFRTNGSVERMRSAYAPTRKRLSESGGIMEDKVVGMSPVITDQEASTLALMGDTIQKYLKKTYNMEEKWDLEWGYVGNKPILFQIRPFNGNKVAKNASLLRTLEPPSEVVANRQLGVNERVLVLVKE